MSETFMDKMVREGQEWIVAALVSRQEGREVFIPFDLTVDFPDGVVPKVETHVYQTGILLRIVDE